jgi:hypothetical protein
MRRQAVHREDRESIASAKARLAMLLASATPEAKAQMTAEGLAAAHRVSVQYAAEALLASRCHGAANG